MSRDVDCMACIAHDKKWPMPSGTVTDNGVTHTAMPLLSAGLVVRWCMFDRNGAPEKVAWTEDCVDISDPRYEGA